jgi:regulator of sigma E protease
MISLALLAEATNYLQVFGQYVWPGILMLIGFSLVIFVHELGHFLVAKAVGIRVDKFALGFGPKLLGFKYGQTEYVIAALPLGGYVKMLGQEDFNALDENAPKDPQAYNNKSVGARFAVIAAGVVMNIIFAGILLVVVGLIGINFPAPVVGSLTAGYPASTAKITWPEPLPGQTSASTTSPASSQATTTEANVSVGMEPGDTIVAINGVPVGRFTTIAVKAALAYKDEVFNMTIRRQIAGKDYLGSAQVGVKERDTMLAFGIGGASDTVIEEAVGQNASVLHKGDRLLAINGQKVEHWWNLPDALRGAEPTNIPATVLRDGKDVTVTLPPAYISGGQAYLTGLDGKSQPLDAAIQEINDLYVRVQYRDGRIENLPTSSISLGQADGELMTVMGMSPRVKIESIASGSPAEKAGLKVGDIIVNYGDLGAAPTRKQLFEINDKFANKGTNIVVLRDGKVQDSIWIVPKKLKDSTRVVMGVLLGLDYDHLIVAGVADNSVAAQAGITSGNEITAVNSKPIANWYELLSELKNLEKQDQGQAASLTVKRNAETFTADLGQVDRWTLDPNSYIVDPLHDVLFKPLMVRIVHANPIAALSWGLQETWISTLDTYASLRALVRGTVASSEVRGPVGIAQIAYKAGQQGFSYFVYLMAIISISLAVINFLPIPVVDGGHAVFLAIEKIRGKPVSVKVMNIAQAIGMALLLGVFLLATWNDIARFIN